MTRLRYQCLGHGNVLVLQHGFLCGPAYWQQTMAALCDQYQVIVPTLPGFADQATEPAINSIPEFADYLLAVLDHAGVDRFHLLGHSMGGMIAQEVALQAQDRVDRLILFGTGPVGEMPGRFETLQESARKVKAWGHEPMIVNTVATWFMRGELDPHFDSMVATARQASLQAILQGYTAMRKWRSLERLGDIKRPTLIVWGDSDRSYRRDQVNQLQHGISNSRLVIMSGCSHNAHLENPATFHRHVAGFLSTADGWNVGRASGVDHEAPP